MDASLGSGAHPSFDPLYCHLSPIRGEGREDAIDHPTCRSAGIDTLGERSKFNLLLMEALKQIGEVDDGTSEAVQSPDTHRITRFDRFEERSETGPVCPCASHRVSKDVLRADASAGQCIDLKIETLIACANASIAPKSAQPSKKRNSLLESCNPWKGLPNFAVAKGFPFETHSKFGQAATYA
jgi:hypothetical protein